MIPAQNPEHIHIKDLLHPSDYSKAMDLRGSAIGDYCICGGDLFHMIGAFEEGELIFYFLDGECVNCGSLVTLPYPKKDDDNA
jgi:hypothetical protein